MCWPRPAQPARTPASGSSHRAQVQAFQEYRNAYYSRSIQGAVADWPGTAAPPVDPIFSTTILLAKPNPCW
jgi:hypothetical protein